MDQDIDNIDVVENEMLADHLQSHPCMHLRFVTVCGVRIQNDDHVEPPLLQHGPYSSQSFAHSVRPGILISIIDHPDNRARNLKVACWLQAKSQTPFVRAPVVGGHSQSLPGMSSCNREVHRTAPFIVTYSKLCNVDCSDPMSPL